MDEEANNRRPPENIRLIDQIMLRFRPIVPRPVTAESSGGVSPTMDGMLKRKRVKRKYVRVKKKESNNNNNTHIIINEKSSNYLDRINGGGEVTDPLEKVSKWISFGEINSNDSYMIFDDEVESYRHQKQEMMHGVDLSMAMEIRQRRVVESWITMEDVTGTCEDQRLLGYTDDEIWKNLETDSCPGFVSNGYQEVVWVNQAYRRMLDLNPDNDHDYEVAVYLLIKVEKSIVAKYFPALSCRVRIEYRTTSSTSENSKMQMMVVPCDVCKMDSGDFAWRLDVKAALSLGLPLIN
uniref:uncharacterized protein LOC122602590 n=1 Tax=Erigeron canadensis TaxID=72917 RepID=UPI001CB95545|nr:uncharacterized protein LOC122602590 [Erigeron canadensis]